MSVRSSVPLEWVPRFDAEIAAGKTSSALITAMKGMRVDPLMSRLPRFLLRPLFALAPISKTADADDIPIRDLVPTMHYDTELVQEIADTPAVYASISADVLLLGGSKSPAYLGTALDALEHFLPHSRRVTLPGLGHTGPEDQPERVAEQLRPFFG